jgi:integrase
MKKIRPREHSSPARPTIVKRKVPVRRRNSDYRSREYLSEKEVGRVIAAAANQGRHGVRDSALILIAYRHGLRVSELVSLRWDQIDLSQGLVHVARLKNGMASVHPLRGPELRALRRLQRIGASAA